MEGDEGKSKEGGERKKVKENEGESKGRVRIEGRSAVGTEYRGRKRK